MLAAPACGLQVCTDSTAVHSIIRIKQDEDKIVPVDSHKVFCISGEAGDRVQFSEYIIANVKLYALRNSTQLSTKSVAHYTRGELATALRKVGACLAPAALQRRGVQRSQRASSGAATTPWAATYRSSTRLGGSGSACRGRP
jgi:hypothetical protein